MDNNRLYLNSDILEDYISVLGKNSYGLEDASNVSKSDFKPLKSNHLYDKGLKKIETSIDKVKNVIDECAHVNKLFISEFFDFEGIMSEKIEGELNIPKNFEVDKSFKENTTDSINLNKRDGLSINNGVAPNNTEEIDNNSSILKEKLKDISNNNAQMEQEINKETAINKQNLGDINSEVEQEEQTISNITEIERKNLSDVNDGVKVSSNMDYTDGQLNNFQEIDKVDMDLNSDENNDFTKVVDNNGIES